MHDCSLQSILSQSRIPLHEKYKPSWIFSKSLATNGHELTPSDTALTGRHGPSRSGRSADIFTPLHNTAMKSSTSLVDRQTDANWHHPSPLWRVVTIRPGRDDPPTFSPQTTTPQWRVLRLSRTDERTQINTIRHLCDGSSWSVPIGTIRRHFTPLHNTAMNVS